VLKAPHDDTAGGASRACRPRQAARQNHCRRLRRAVRRRVRWVRLTLSEHSEPVYRQDKRGRPSPTTRYVRRHRVRFDISWQANLANIQYDARCDGIFPSSPIAETSRPRSFSRHRACNAARVRPPAPLASRRPGDVGQHRHHPPRALVRLRRTTRASSSDYRGGGHVAGGNGRVVPAQADESRFTERAADRQWNWV